jgi:hypothetical protein
MAVANNKRAQTTQRNFVRFDGEVEC